MSKPRAIPLAAQVEAAVERAEAAEAKVASLKRQVGDLTRAHQQACAHLDAMRQKPPKSWFDEYIAEMRKAASFSAEAAAHRTLGEYYSRELDTAKASVRELRAALEAAKAALPKPGAVIALPQRPAPFTMGEMFCLLTGLGLGAIAGGMLL